MNSIYVVFSKNDTEFVQSFKSCAKREELNLDFSFGETGEFETIEKKIDDSAAILLLTSDAFREDCVVKQAVKYAHDLNKTFIAMGFHNGGVFNRQSWLKNEMDVNTTIYGYNNAEQLGEVLAQLRSAIGSTVAMGERIGGLVVFDIDSPCSLTVNNKVLFHASTPGSYQYRFKAGEVAVTFMSDTIKGANVYEKLFKININDHITFNDSIRNKEINYINKSIFDLNENIKTNKGISVKKENQIAECEREIEQINRYLNEPKIILPPAEASTGTIVLWSFILGGVGLCFWGFGAVIGIVIAQFVAKNQAESERKKKQDEIDRSYELKRQKLNKRKQDANSNIIFYKNNIKKIDEYLVSQQQRLDRAYQLLELYK